MKTILLPLLFTTIIVNNSVAQKAYRISHAWSIQTSVNIEATPIHYLKTIIAEGNVYMFPSKSSKPDKNTSIYGDKIKHHSMYYFSKTGEHYYGNSWPPLSKPYFAKSPDRYEPNAWVVDTSISHYYKDYRCANAYKVSSPGDTTFVIYTPDIKYPPGFRYYNDLPGLMLESFNTVTGYYYKVVNIEIGSFQIVLPKKSRFKKST